MKFIVFSKKTCPFCIKAREILESLDLEHYIVNFEKDQFSVLEEIKTAHDWKTVPMVFLKNDSLVEFIGGYTDLLERLEVGKED